MRRIATTLRQISTQVASIKAPWIATQVSNARNSARYHSISTSSKQSEKIKTLQEPSDLRLSPRQIQPILPLASNLLRSRIVEFQKTMEKQGSITVKAFLQRPGSVHTEIRRFPLPAVTSGQYDQLLTAVSLSFPGLTDLQAGLTLTWRDRDGDYVLMTTDEELRDALSEVQNRQLNVYITVEPPESPSHETYEPFTLLTETPREDQETGEGMEETQGQGHAQGQPPNTSDASDQQTGGEKPATPEGNQSIYPPLPPPPPPPPMPHIFPWVAMFGPEQWAEHGRHGHQHGPMRRRGHHHGHAHHGPPHHHGHAHHHQWHGHPFGYNPGWLDFGFGFGPRMNRMFGFGWPQGPRGGRHAHWQGGRSKAENEGQGEEVSSGCRGFKNLVSQVPCKQRRWAKQFIRQWLQKHQQGKKTAFAAQTNEEENRDHVTSMEEAQVSQAYVDWLNQILPKFYSSQAENSKDPKEPLTDEKSAVPMAFQKWCLWFLSWNRECRKSCDRKVTFRPEEETESAGCQRGGKSKKEWKKEWKAFRKNMKAAVPLKYRMWARSYIKQWRQDHMIIGTDSDITSSSSSSSSESEDTEQTRPEVVDVPEDYRKWMDKFLACWHARKGFDVKGSTDSTEESFAQFKETVPVEFRKWVRCFVNRRGKKLAKRVRSHKKHGHKHGGWGKHGARREYRQWKKLARQQWLEQGGLADVVSTSSSSSSSSSSSDDDDDEKRMAASFKRMRIEPQQSSTKDGSGRPSGSDKPKVAPEMTSSGPGEVTSPEMTPRMQYFMVKMMSKLQAKQMKLARKAAKRDMKLAWKAYRKNY